MALSKGEGDRPLVEVWLSFKQRYAIPEFYRQNKRCSQCIVDLKHSQAFWLRRKEDCWSPLVRSYMEFLAKNDFKYCTLYLRRLSRNCLMYGGTRVHWNTEPMNNICTSQNVFYWPLAFCVRNIKVGRYLKNLEVVRISRFVIRNFTPPCKGVNVLNFAG